MRLPSSIYPTPTLISGSPSSTSSFVSAMPWMPDVLMACRTSTASNQPQRRLRPVTVPNSRPFGDIFADFHFPVQWETGLNPRVV